MMPPPPPPSMVRTPSGPVLPPPIAGAGQPSPAGSSGSGPGMSPTGSTGSTGGGALQQQGSAAKNVMAPPPPGTQMKMPAPRIVDGRQKFPVPQPGVLAPPTRGASGTAPPAGVTFPPADNVLQPKASPTNVLQPPDATSPAKAVTKNFDADDPRSPSEGGGTPSGRYRPTYSIANPAPGGGKRAGPDGTAVVEPASASKGAVPPPLKGGKFDGGKFDGGKFGGKKGAYLKGLGKKGLLEKTVGGTVRITPRGGSGSDGAGGNDFEAMLRSLDVGLTGGNSMDPQAQRSAGSSYSLERGSTASGFPEGLKDEDFSQLLGNLGHLVSPASWDAIGSGVDHGGPARQGTGAAAPSAPIGGQRMMSSDEDGQADMALQNIEDITGMIAGDLGSDGRIETLFPSTRFPGFRISQSFFSQWGPRVYIFR